MYQFQLILHYKDLFLSLTINCISIFTALTYKTHSIFLTFSVHFLTQVTVALKAMLLSDAIALFYKLNEALQSV